MSTVSELKEEMPNELDKQGTIGPFLKVSKREGYNSEMNGTYGRCKEDWHGKPQWMQLTNKCGDNLYYIRYQHNKKQWIFDWIYQYYIFAKCNNNNSTSPIDCNKKWKIWNKNESKYINDPQVEIATVTPTDIEKEGTILPYFKISGRNGYNSEMNGIYGRCKEDWRGTPQWKQLTNKSGQKLYYIRYQKLSKCWVFDWIRQYRTYAICDIPNIKSPFDCNKNWKVWSNDDSKYVLDPIVTISKIEIDPAFIMEEASFTNPLWINIAVSKNDHLNDLPDCELDKTKIKQICQIYGYQTTTHNTMRLTVDQFEDKLLAGRTKINSDKTIDSIIISYSGHGDGDSVLLSDYDGASNGKYSILDIMKFFSGRQIRKQLLNCPKLLILDSCRGNNVVKTIAVKPSFSKGNGLNLDKKKKERRHPDQDWGVIYANTIGNESNNANDGSGGFLISSLSKILNNPSRIHKKDIAVLTRWIRNDVMKNSKSTQCVEFTESYTRSVYFAKNC